MGQLGKKKVQTGSENSGNLLQVPGTMVADSSDIPLVIVNDGAGPLTARETTRERRGSRSINVVSMSDDGEKDEFPGQKSTMLHELILMGEVEEVEKLLAKGTNVNTRDKSGKTPLHAAILSGPLTIAVRLLECNADVTKTDAAGHTALHTAIHVGSESMVLTLLQQGRAEPNAVGRNSCTPLHLAAEMDNEKICKILIDNSGDPHILDDDGMTPLAHAIERGARKSAEFLLQHAHEKGKVEDFLYDVDVDGNSLLHLAVNSSVLTVVELCIEYGVRIRQPRKRDKVTAFHIACELGSMPIVEYLVSKDPAICRITLVDFKGKTPLHLAAIKNHVHIVEFLLDRGASIDPMSDDRHTPLFRAADNGAVDVVKHLMERGADVTIRDTELQSVLQAAVGHPHVMEVLIQSPAVMSLITEKDVHGYSAVHYAAMKGDIKDLELFVAKNKTAAIVTSDSLDTPIHVAAKYGWTEAMEKLMDRQNSRVLNLLNSQGRTALHYACLEGNDRTTQMLLKLGATVERDKSGRSPLHLAALKGSVKCCEAIVETCDDCYNLEDKDKNTALHLAAINGHAPVVTLLLSNPKFEITWDSRDDNILDAAVKEKRTAVVMAIAEHDRWREVLTTCSKGVLPMLKKLVKTMPDTVVRFLDQLVTSTGDPTSENYKITYDLGLIQGKYEVMGIKRRKRTTVVESGEYHAQDNVYVINKIKRVKDTSKTNSLSLIETMAVYRRKRCLTHPITFHLLNTKWKKFGWITFAMNLLFYLLFLAPLTTLAVYSRVKEDELCGFNSSNPEEDKFSFSCSFSNVVVQVLTYFVLILAAGHLLKEFLSLISKTKAYFLDVSNYVEWACYVTAMIYCIPPCDCKAGFKRQVAAVSLFFGWMNLSLFLRKLASYGQYVIMLTTMFVTMMKVLLLWMLFIMAFATMFLMLMDDQPFNELGTSMMTMFVMTLGELDYRTNFMPWDNLTFAPLTNFLFVVLVLMMPIILMNMLVGLAVGDIDKIQQSALMDRYVQQITLLVEIESFLPEFILKRVQIYSHTEFPNHPRTFKNGLLDLLIGFHKPEDSDKRKTDEASPEKSNVKQNVQQQNADMQKVFEILREQSEMLKEIRQENSKKGTKEPPKEEQTSFRRSLFDGSIAKRLF